MNTKIFTLFFALSTFSICYANNNPSNENTMDKKFTKVDVKTLNENAVKLIGDEWMLITAGAKEKLNTMTASWGSIGVLWNKPVATVFIRPQRYTHEFVDSNEYFTLSFFAKDYKKALQICGTVSGRDKDKIKEAGLTPYFTEENGTPAFKEARIIVECKKIYVDKLKEEGFIDKEIADKNYPKDDFHTIFIGEIVNVWVESN